jgi:uncharacterized membrane protein YdbT with pleckstrin-like domain
MNNSAIQRQLFMHERQIVTVRRHPIVLSLPLATALTAIIAAVGTVVVRQSQSVHVIVWLVSAFFFVVSIARLMDWFSGYLVITSKRVLLRFGRISRDFTTLNLDAIADVQLHRSVRGSLIGYGDLLITVRGGGSQLITYVPYSEQIYLELGAVIEAAHNPDVHEGDDADEM